MKRFISALLCTAFAVVLAAPAFAAKPRLILSSAEVPEGTKEVTLTLSVDNIPSITAARVYLTCQSDLVPVYAELGDGIDGWYSFGKPKQNGSGTSVTAFAWAEGIESYGGYFELASFTFVMPETARAGDVFPVTLTAAPDDVIDINEAPVGASTVSSQITVVPAPEHVPGDVNGDGKITLKDAQTIIRYVAGWNGAIDADIADVNCDGEVNAKDVALILKYLCGWNVTLGKQA